MTFVEQVAVPDAWRSPARPSGASQDNTLQQSETATGFQSRNRRSALLNQIVEAEILPRLALARTHAAPKATATRAGHATSEDDTAELVRLLLGPDDERAFGFVESMEGYGATPASLYLGLITQAARLLGVLWEEDRCDFAQVTIGLGRLQQIVRALSPGFQMGAVSRSAHADTVLLVPAPGEQHTFGLILLAEFFQRDGWHVAGGPACTSADAATLVHDSWIDIVGFSAGSSKHIDSLTACIRAVRKASRNQCLGVMVGGPLFLQRPELVSRVGADTTAADAPSAIQQAKGLLAIRAAAD